MFKKFVLSLSLFFCVSLAFAQGEKQVIRFSGLIVDGDSAYGVPGVHIYVPKAGRGTSTDYYGTFSMPTLAGDTVIISAIGFRRQYIIIPDRREAAYSVLINLKNDTTYLPVVEVFPYPSVEVFKEAFIALELPTTAEEALAKNLDRNRLATLSLNLPMSAAANYRYYTNQHYSSLANKNSATSISLLNPFAWVELINAIKRGDFKRKKN